MWLKIASVYGLLSLKPPGGQQAQFFRQQIDSTVPTRESEQVSRINQTERYDALAFRMHELVHAGRPSFLLPLGLVCVILAFLSKFN